MEADGDGNNNAVSGSGVEAVQEQQLAADNAASSHHSE